MGSKSQGGSRVQYPASWQKQENVYGTHGVQFTRVNADRDNVLIDVLTEPDLYTYFPTYITHCEENLET